MIDTQWRILQRLSVTHPHVYEELSKYYADILKDLNDYHRSVIIQSKSNKPHICLAMRISDRDIELENKLDLSVLEIKISSEAACIDMQKKMIKLLDKIVRENIIRYYFNSVTDTIIDCLLYIVSECNMELKLMAFEVYVNVLAEYPIKNMGLPFTFTDKLNSFIEYLEPLIYDIFNKKIDVTSSEHAQFENMLTVFLNNTKNLDDKFTVTTQNIAAFLIDKEMTESLQQACCDQTFRMPLLPSQEQMIIDLILEKNSYNLMRIIQKQLIYDIQVFICTNLSDSRICLFSDNFISRTWIIFDNRCRNKLRENSCKANCCQYLNSLTLIKHWLATLVYLVIEIQNYNIIEKNRHSPILNIFSIDDIFEQTKYVLYTHNENCGQRMETDDVNNLLQNIFAICSVTSSHSHTEFWYYCIAFPFVNKYDYTSVAEFQNIAAYLSNQKFNKGMVVEYLSLFMNVLSTGIIQIQSKEIERLQKIHLKVVKSIVHDDNIEVSCEVSIIDCEFVENSYFCKFNFRF